MKAIVFHTNSSFFTIANIGIHKWVIYESKYLFFCLELLDDLINLLWISLVTLTGMRIGFDRRISVYYGELLVSSAIPGHAIHSYLTQLMALEELNEAQIWIRTPQCIIDTLSSLTCSALLKSLFNRSRLFYCNKNANGNMGDDGFE